MTIRRALARGMMAKEDAFGEPEPTRPVLFESAVQRQFTGLGEKYKYDEPCSVAATLCYGLAMNHAFENGNKRTALVSMLVSLDRNGVTLVGATETDLFEMITSLVKHELPVRRGATRNADSEVDGLAAWLATRSRRLTLGDRKLYFSELQEILTSLGCTLDPPNQNFVKIRHGGLSVKTGYPRHEFEIAVNEVKRIRRGLKLDEVAGVDKAAFYDLEAQTTGFVNKYRQLLRRLADV